MLLEKRIPIFYIIKKVRRELFYVLILSLVVVLITGHFKDVLPIMPLTIPAFLGTAISILLSFKLNQSYDRWWEARKIWGSIVNDSRTLIIQLKSFTSDANEDEIKRIAYRQIAFAYSLGQSLRNLDPTENLDEFITSEEMEKVKKYRNKPLALIQLHALEIKKLYAERKIELFSQIQLDKTLMRLVESQGKAERIKSTVFPVTYRMFLHYVIYLFLVTLSLSLKDIAGFFEIPLLLFVASAFFLLEKSATHMQDPFENKPSDIAVTAIAKTIEINIRELLNETHLPEPYSPAHFYIT